MNLLRFAVAAAGAAFACASSAQPNQSLINVMGPTPTTYVIDVSNFAFSPQPIRLRDMPVTLKFVNHSGSGHDFTAPEFFARAEAWGNPAMRLPRAIALGPHQTRTITLVPHTGRYQAYCSHFLHKQMGMSVPIIVD